MYAFANPLAIAFGFWGFLVWGFYFLTTFYFLTVEPHLRLFEIPAVKFVNNVIIIGTCAFTAHLLLQNLPFYVPSIGDGARYGIVAGTVLLSVLTSTHIRYIRVLSVASMWLFGALVGAMWLVSGMGARGLADSAADIGPYFMRLPHFVLPMSDYHAFYLFWWFSWSIMIGQFVSRFVGGMRAWQLAATLLVIPSIPLAAWFSVLYFYFRQQVQRAAGADGGDGRGRHRLRGQLARLADPSLFGQPRHDGRRMGTRSICRRSLAADVRPGARLSVHAAPDRVDRPCRHRPLRRDLLLLFRRRGARCR